MVDRGGCGLDLPDGLAPALEIRPLSFWIDLDCDAADAVAVAVVDREVLLDDHIARCPTLRVGREGRPAKSFHACLFSGRKCYHRWPDADRLECSHEPFERLESDRRVVVGHCFFLSFGLGFYGRGLNNVISYIDYMSIADEKVLVIGTDTTIFDPRSSAGLRIREYARLFDEYHMIIYTSAKHRGLLSREEKCPERAKRGEGPEYELQQESSSPTFLYPTNSRFFFMRPLDAFRIGKKIIRERGIKVVSVQDPAETGIAGWLLKKSLGIKLHIQLHADFFSPFFRKNSWKERLRYWLAKFIIPRGDAFRVVSQRIKKTLATTYNLQLTSFSVLPIFVDRAKIAAAKLSFDLRSKYHQFDFIVLIVSRLTREKNINMAVEAFSELVKEFPKSGLVIVGDGPEFRNLRATTYRLQARNSVCFEGWQDDLISYYKGADLYLLTSNFEGYSRTVVEAAAAGCPVVMTDVGVAGEIIRDGETGRVIKVNDAHGLADILRWARQNREKMSQMAQKTQSEVLSLPPKSWGDYLMMYKESI